MSAMNAMSGYANADARALAWFREINSRLGMDTQRTAEWKALQAIRDGTWMDPKRYEETVTALER